MFMLRVKRVTLAQCFNHTVTCFHAWLRPPVGTVLQSHHYMLARMTLASSRHGVSTHFTCSHAWLWPPAGTVFWHTITCSHAWLRPPAATVFQHTITCSHAWLRPPVGTVFQHTITCSHAWLRPPVGTVFQHTITCSHAWLWPPVGTVFQHTITCSHAWLWPPAGTVFRHTITCSHAWPWPPAGTVFQHTFTCSHAWLWPLAGAVFQHTITCSHAWLRPPLRGEGWTGRHLHLGPCGPGPAGRFAHLFGPSPACLHFHPLRRGACHLAFGQGASVTDIQALGGWRSQAVACYLPLDAARARAAASLSAATFPPQPRLGP